MAKRSNEPIFWSLFGAGGVVVAFILPMLIFITGLAVPLGLLPIDVLSFDRLHSFALSWPGKLFIFVVISLPLWHGMHRIFLSLHDFGINKGRLFFKWLCYGLATLVSLLTIILLVTV